MAENFDDARKWPEGLDDETRDSAAREDNDRASPSDQEPSNVSWTSRAPKIF